MPAVKGKPNRGQFKKGHDPKRHVPGATPAPASGAEIRTSPGKSARTKQERIVRAFRHVMLRGEEADKTHLQRSLRVLFHANVKRFFDAMDAEEKKLAREQPDSAEATSEANADDGTRDGMSVMDRLWQEFQESKQGGPS